MNPSSHLNQTKCSLTLLTAFACALLMWLCVDIFTSTNLTFELQLHLPLWAQPITGDHCLDAQN